MTNNDILRRLRYSFDFNDDKMIELFALGELTANRAQISDWLKKEDDPAHATLSDHALASFLNGFIIARRGRRDGPQPKAEQRLTRNLILTKLKIALNLKAEDMLDILALVNFRLSNHELSALFRKPGHKHYRECKDQILRNFLHGVQLKYRDGTPYAASLD